jgi:LysM repeat protein
MTEGGFFPWRMQKIVSRGPTGDYSGLRSPLPKPPDGMAWQQEGETKEWRLAAIEPELAEESGSNNDDEWEMLSDKVSVHSGGLYIAKSGSVRSITDESYSLPYKIQRTHSSSTIDSNDNTLGPSGKGVLGVDYVEHVILPTDTLQGICLAYKINSTRLRQANHFSGNSLLLAPKKLVIPLSKKALRSGFIRVQDTDAKEYKLHALLAEFPELSMHEAKAYVYEACTVVGSCDCPSRSHLCVLYRYLELSDWVLKDAVQSAKEDKEWEREMDASTLKSGEIRITMNMNNQAGVPRFNAQGAGLHPKNKVQKEEKVQVQVQVMPAIATKTVKAQDVYKASTQHSQIGVELQPLTKS